MTREFESELAVRVADRKASRPAKKVIPLLAAVAVCAMLGATALISAAMNGDTGAPMTEIVIFDQEKSEFSETVATDDGEVVNVLATRVMNLKVKGDHLHAGDSCVLQDAKFVYVLNANIQAVSYDDGSAIDWEGMELGRLALPAAVGDMTVADPKVSVCDGSGNAVAVGTAAFVSYSGTEVVVNVPGLLESGYDVGYSISISVTIFTTGDLSEDLAGETVTETAWADEGAAISEVI